MTARDPYALAGRLLAGLPEGIVTEAGAVVCRTCGNESGTNHQPDCAWQAAQHAQAAETIGNYRDPVAERDAEIDVLRDALRSTTTSHHALLDAVNAFVNPARTVEDWPPQD